MPAILIEKHPTQDGRQVVEIVLNAPKALNALDLGMIDALQRCLDECRDDPAVVAVLLDGQGEKAFCAGGDVVGLRRSCLAGDVLSEATAFFSREYRLDHTLHGFNKPVIAWGSGIVMGGGMGLLCACSHRVVTETSMLAMPEITIGLYPDVGGSWFLNRAPGRTGLFLALTGARINGADACFVGFADRQLHSSQRAALCEQLLAANWAESPAAVVDALLKKLQSEAAVQQTSVIRERFDAIQAATDFSTAEEVVNGILAHDSAEDRWFGRAQKTLAHGSPMAAGLIHRQLQQTTRLSLAEVFRAELIASVRCCMQPDFFEGVRALLVDKDGAPQWRHAAVDQVQPGELDCFFEAPWASHPLADLH